MAIIDLPVARFAEPQFVLSVTPILMVQGPRRLQLALCGICPDLMHDGGEFFQFHTAGLFQEGDAAEAPVLEIFRGQTLDASREAPRWTCKCFAFIG